MSPSGRAPWLLTVIVPIEVAIFLNMSVPYLRGEELTFMGYLMVSSMQLGATVDYSILLTNNYLELRSEIEDKKKAPLPPFPGAVFRFSPRAAC